MNAYSRTLPLHGAVRPVRERGASALDRVVIAWPAPDPSARVLDSWGAPTGPAVVHAGVAPWPAPDPVMRFDLPAPRVRVFAPTDGPVPRTDLVEPRHAVRVPDLQSASRAAVAPSTAGRASEWSWPAPTFADTSPVATSTPDRSGISTRLVIGLAAAAGALAVGATAFISLF